MKRSSVAVVDAPAAAVAPADDLAALRRRLSGATAREAVLVDFLDDDLREAEALVSELSSWLAAVGSAVRSPRASRHELVALAGRSPGPDDAEALGTALSSVRRRLALVAVSLARAGE